MGMGAVLYCDLAYDSTRRCGSAIAQVHVDKGVQFFAPIVAFTSGSTEVVVLSFQPGNFCPLLFCDIRCCDPGPVQHARAVLRSSTHAANRSVLALAFREEHSPEKQRAYQDNANEVDTQRPRGLRITAGTNTVNSREGKDAQCQYMQLPPQLVADVRS